LEVKQSRRERKKEETKQRILEVALELFRRQGFAATTVEQITEGADVGKGTFYNYFETKEAVISYYMKSVGDEKRKLIRPVLRQLPDTKSRLTWLFKGWAEFVRENRELVRIYMSETFKEYLTYGNINPDETGFEKFQAEIIGWGQEQGDIKKYFKAEDLGKYLNLLIFGPSSWYCAVSEDFPIEEKIAEAVGLFLEGAAHEGDGCEGN